MTKKLFLNSICLPVLVLTGFLLFGTGVKADNSQNITAGETSTLFNNFKKNFYWQHTVSGESPILLVFLHTTGNYINSVSYGGQAMTLATKSIKTQPYNNIGVYAYYLVNPLQGTNTITVDANNTVAIFVSAITFYNSNETNPIYWADGFFDGATQISHATTTVSDNVMFVDSVSYNKPDTAPINPNVGQTQYLDYYRKTITNNLYCGESYKLAEQAGLHSMGWQTSATFSSVQVIVALNPKNIKKINPVIIVPGILGSYLNKNITGDPNIWPNLGETIISPSDEHLLELKLNEAGWPIDNNIYATDIIRQILTSDTFDGLIEELKNNGYEENKNLFVFPYDWRLNIDWIAGDSPYAGYKFETLKQKIDEILISTGSEKVDIIAHSMGGLVTKRYMQKYGSEKIDKFVDIGTPHLGAPKAFKALMFGDNFGFELQNMDILNSKTLKEIAQNMPSTYQLLPSSAYLNSTNSDYQSYAADIYDIDGNNYTGNLNYEDSMELLENTGRNSMLIPLNNELHSSIDDFTYNNTYNLVGCGQPTIGKIYILNKEKSGGYEYGLKYINGDGTVPIKSAENFSAPFAYINNQSHAELPSANGIRQIVTAILKDNVDDLNFSGYPEVTLDGSNCALNGTQISFHSPIELHIYDKEGNHVGVNENGDIEMNIPGVAYDEIDGNKFAFLPNGREYKISGKATEQGTFNARLEKIEKGNYVQTTYYNEVPLNSATAAVQLSVSGDGLSSNLELDENGDQEFETNLEPDSVLNEENGNDYNKPNTSINISGDLGNNNFYISDVIVGLDAQDDNSGILKTEYSFDGGQSWIKYGSPFTITQEGENKILYSSTDRAGNRELENEQIVKIDKTRPEILTLVPEEIRHNEKLNIDFITSDNYSGIASSTISFDNRLISTSTVDLFYIDLGEHSVKISAEDVAGNKAEEMIKVNIITDIQGTISDINREFDEKMINEKAKKELIKDLDKINDYIIKNGKKEKVRDKNREKLMQECVKKKGTNWCERKLGKIFQKIEFRINKIQEIYIKMQYREILRELDRYVKKGWVNKISYDIIKKDINYLLKKYE